MKKTEVGSMKVGRNCYKEIIITKHADGLIVTEDSGHEVIAVISDDDEIIVKNGYEVKMIPAPNND